MFALSHQRSFRTLSTLLVVAAVLATPLVSQSGVVVEDDRVPLSLEDVVAIALERNLGLKVENLRFEESEWALFGEYGIYDLTLTGRLSALDETSPAASNLDGAEVRQFDQQQFNLGLSQLTPIGGTVGVQWNNLRQETNSTFSLLNPSYGIDFDFTYDQPLLRDRGKLATERRIVVAQNNYEISRETFERQVITTVSQAKQRYWNLVDAQLQLEVDNEALQLAEQLHEQNQVRVEVGTLPQLELVQSEAGVAQRREAVISSTAAVLNAEDELRRLLDLEDSLWSVPIETTTAPEMEEVPIDLEAGIASALEHRPEITTQELVVENLLVDENYYRNQRMPRLDLAVTYGYNGLGGDVTQRDFITGEILGTAEGGYGDAFDQITGTDFEGWAAAVNLLMPLQNRSAEALQAMASIGRERGEAELADLEAEITAEVRRTARLVETAAALIDSTTASRRLAEENLNAEQKRFDNGLSTSFQVLEIQEDLSQARSRQAFAITAYRKALVEYLRVTGRLLEQSGVELASVEDSD